MSERKELPTVERCEVCRFWKAKVKVPFQRQWPEKGGWDTLADYEDLTDDPAGECRRYPQPLDKFTYDWCGEWKPIPLSPSPFAFSGWLMDRSVRVRKSINRRGVKSLSDLFAIAPSDYKHLGMTGYLEVVDSLRTAGVVVPETWTW